MNRDETVTVPLTKAEKDAILRASFRYGCDYASQFAREALFELMRDAGMEAPITLLEARVKGE